MTLDDDITSYLKKKPIVGFRDLLRHLRSGNPSVTDELLADAIWSLERKGVVVLEDTLAATASAHEYITFWERNLDVYFILGFSLMTVLTVFVTPSTFPFVAIRLIFGSVSVLFIPGFALTEALFPKGNEIDRIERFALSVGLSLAIVPMLGLILNYTPWGIRLTPIVALLAAFTLGISAACFGRRFRMTA